MKTPTFLLAGLTLLTLVACSAPAPTPTPGPTTPPSPVVTPTPLPTPNVTPPPSPTPGAASLTDLKYVLLTQIGRPDWCDPDIYPVAQEDEGKLAQQHLAEMRADAEVFAAILAHLGIDPSVELTGASLLAVYRDWKVLT